MPRFKMRPYTSSVSFNGSSSALAKASPTGINTGTANVTVVAWIYLTSDALGTVCALETSSNNTRAMSVGQQGGVYYMFSDGVTINRTISKGLFNIRIGLNTWRRIVYSTSGTNIDIWVDGVLLTSQTMTISTTALANLFLGRRTIAAAPGLLFSGYMKDVQIYNQYFTLSDAKRDYYNAEMPYTAVSSFAMEEGSGSAVADQVGSNSLTGTDITWTTQYVPFKDRSLATNEVVGSGRTVNTGRSLIT